MAKKKILMVSGDYIELDESPPAAEPTKAKKKPASKDVETDPPKLRDAGSHKMGRPLLAKKQPGPGVDWRNEIEPPRPPVQADPPPANETPDWLANVAEIAASLRAESSPGVGAPMDWLADVQQVEGHRLPTPPKPTEVVSDAPEPPQAAQAPAPTPSPPVSNTAESAVAKDTAADTAGVGTPMDWLADVQQVEGLRQPTPPKPTEVVVDVPEPPPQAAQAAAPMPPSPVSNTAAKESGQAHKDAVTPPESAAPKCTATETGYDPDTGQILDQEKYDIWQRNRVAKAAIDAPVITTESIREVFLSARNAVATWVDDDSRRTLIMEINLDDLKQHPEVQVLLSSYQNYGYVMREKLLHHLEWIVINRRKYYAACSK